MVSSGLNQLTKVESSQAQIAVVAPPCAMVIFGAAGDLTKRLVVPVRQATTFSISPSRTDRAAQSHGGLDRTR
jgi:hypothetical protein